MAPNEIDKEQEKAIDQRPNYFAGQYLLEDDFQLEQKYHIDRQRRHNRLLHVSGIAEGLKVSLGEDKKVKVSAGTAIDSQGRQIILPDDQSVDLLIKKNNNQDGDYNLSIKYSEVPTHKQESEGSQETTNRRVQETPAFELSSSTTPDVIPLAKLTIKGGKVENEENIDQSVRQYSGISLPTEDGKGVTLRSQREDNSNIARLNGGLSISGKLSVTGHTQLNNTLTVTESTNIKNNLTVKSLMVGENETGFTLRSQGDENTNLAILDGSLRIGGNLSVTGHTQLNNTLTVKENTTLQKDLNISGNLNITGTNNLTGNINTNGSLTAGIITAERVFVKSGFIQKEGDAPIANQGSDMGIYSRRQGFAMRFVTNGGDFYFFKDGDYGKKEEDRVLAITQEGNLIAKGKIKATRIEGRLIGKEQHLEGKFFAKNVEKIEGIADDDGFIIAWIWARKDGERGSIDVYVRDTKDQDILRGTASVHNYPEKEAHITRSSTTVPVRKDEKYIVLKEDTFGTCDWRVYWQSIAGKE
ncbi:MULTISPECIES: hypothetical protein [unclassified Microcoleus]|uniref:hypothetical protein n=1 Tax=unclassified Microcoleus TaxID=2642155 RepID=UPI002FCFB91C